jgi:hypothetical protein
MRVPPYYKQKKPYTCSLAALRMVFGYFGVIVSESELVNKVVPDYGPGFKNLWNSTVAKLSCQAGINTTMYAAWPLFKKTIFQQALSEYKSNPDKMNFRKYENPTDKDQLTEPLPLAYKEMFKAIELGCKCSYGKLTERRIRLFLSENCLIQTSVKLHLLYPGQKRVYHSVLIYKIRDDKVYYHDPAHGENLFCSLNHLLRAANNVGAAIVYRGLT